MACSADRRAPMPTGIIRAPATPVVAAEPATARPLVVELSMSVFTHPSIVPKCVCLSVVCCLIMWCMRCDWFKSRRKAESKPLLSCGDGSDPWEAEDLIVQIGIPAREFVRISTIPPCSGVWKGPIELRACPQSPRRGRWRMARRCVTLGSLWAASYPYPTPRSPNAANRLVPRCPVRSTPHHCLLPPSRRMLSKPCQRRCMACGDLGTCAQPTHAAQGLPEQCGRPSPERIEHLALVSPGT